MKEQNIEIQNAQQAIKLLKLCSVAKTQEEKDKLLKQLEGVDKLTYLYVIKRGYEPFDLAQKIEKAIKLDKYRPKNLPIVQLALNKYLENIHGEFDTFDNDINKMLKNNEKPENIRDRFKAATVNIYVLAKRFSNDWVRRLNNHKDLADAARNADEKTAVDAYNKLFWVLAQDFSKEYNNIQIHPKVVVDWANSDVKPKGEWNKVNGFQTTIRGAFLKTANMSESEIQKLKEECDKNPDEHKVSKIRVNITNIRNKYKTPNDFFYGMISVFAHEMHHALDWQNPREGALGPQIAHIDKQIYVPVEDNEQAYHASATEISSYVIEDTLLDHLKNTRF